MPAEQPNVLIILTDQLQRDFVGAYGHPLARTPHIDRLAEDGVRLTRAYVPLPQCSPSRASMFTGHYPHQHQLMLNGSPGRVWNTPAGSIVNRPRCPNRCRRSVRRSKRPGTEWDTRVPGTWQR